MFSPNCRADLGDHRCRFPIQPPELGRDQAVSEGAFYRVPTTAGTGSARYEDRIHEVIEAGTTAASQPAYDTAIGATTIDGTAALKAYESFTRVASVEAVTDHRIFTLTEALTAPPTTVEGVKYWLACHTDVGVNSRGSDGTNQNDARRLIAQSYAGGLPDPFGAGSTFNNTRGLRMKIWTNP